MYERTNQKARSRSSRRCAACMVFDSTKAIEAHEINIIYDYTAPRLKNPSALAPTFFRPHGMLRDDVSDDI